MTPRKIVVFGASTVYGRADQEGGGFVARLRRWHEPKHPLNVVYNLGVSGETTTSMRERFVDEVRRRRPDLILLSVGLNDIHREGAATAACVVPVTRHEENVHVLIKEAKSLAQVVWIGQFAIDERKTNPYHGTHWHYLASDAHTYVKAGERVCRNEGIPHVEVWDAWSGQNSDTFLHTDGLHCNAHGHQKLFEMVRDFLTVMYP